MRSLVPVLIAGWLSGVLAFTLAGCNGGSSNPTQPTLTEVAALPPATVPTAINPAEVELSGSSIVEATGTSTGALGLYWLEIDPTDPTTAKLTMSRSVAAQGDLYALSIRPYMVPTSLTLTGSAAGPDSTTDYGFRFTHPFAMPADLQRPHSATKRVDLFINDVNIVLAISGADTFFAGAIKTNIQAMPNASGYRMTGPLFNAAAIGVGGGTNVFPYRLLTRASTSSPAGNFDASNGWRDAELLNPSGYDVIGQGQSATTTLRINNGIGTPLPLVVIAKYMDPRAGETPEEKRANRLPDPEDPTACRYFMPEGAGDLQEFNLTVAGSLKADSSSEAAAVSGTVLDWDNAAVKATTFPNQSNLNRISEISKPHQVEISFPQLKASGTFAGSVGASSGGINQFIALSANIYNVDRTYAVQNVAGDTVYGLLRVRDQQDGTAPAPQILDENLVVQSPSASFELSTRFQRLGVTVLPGPQSFPPNLTAVSPLTGVTGTDIELAATNTGGAVASWSWNFGGGATPNTSTSTTPNITLGDPGNYNCTVTATNAAGSDPLNFVLVVAPTVPEITEVTPLLGDVGSSQTFNATNVGGVATTWSWNFGGGATPNTSTSAAPDVTLGTAGSYSCTVTATNVTGNDVFPFTLVVNLPPPDLTAVSPLTGGTGAMQSFSATNIGGAATSWSWDFGGGATPNTSTQANPTPTLGAIGTYNCSVTATNPTGNDVFPFTLEVTACSVPNITAVNFTSLAGLRSSTASATVSGSPTTWSWNFGGGATPNTSTSASPVLTLGTPGTYNGTVTASNTCGIGNTFPFVLEVGYKSLALRIRVITNGAQLPTRLNGMAASGWSRDNVNAWITQYVNPLYANSAVRFDTALTDYANVDNPTLFNISTQSENNQLWNLVLGQPADKINVWVINSQPNAPGLGGVMSDGACNLNNTNRGCYIIPFNEGFDQVVMPHEIGHIFSLPHIRTDTSPITSQNQNLMSYGTLNTSLSTNITREDPSGCNLHTGNPMNQFGVTNSWAWTYM